jgi:hypothetical protein
MIQLGQYREELYDLAADPHERTNLAGDRRRREPLRRLIRELHATPPQSAAEIDADEKARIEQELKDLGYM